MSHDPGLQQLLDQFANSIGLENLQLNEDGLCAVRFSGAITVEMCADGNRLLLYSDCGPVQLGSEVHLYPELLQANLFWQSTHGGTLSITDDSPPRVILAVQSEWAHLTAVQFEGLVEHFVDTAEKWIKRLNNMGNEPAEFTDPASPSPARWDMLRG
jgi:Tir chaperone protein (CesT) family